VTEDDPLGGPFATALGDRGRRAMAHAAVRRHWPAGRTLFHEGAVADLVLLLLEGTVKVVSTSATGAEAVLALRGPGELVGELGAIDGRPRSAAAVATEPVVALAVPADAFRGLLHEHPAAAVALLELVVDRLRDAERKRAEFGSLDATHRVAHRLAELAERRGLPGEGGWTVGLSQDELAGLSGASREAVARALRALREAGLIQTGRRQITIRDAAGLRRWAG
jgi:CRP/FNR family transcriptional regulator, cyclic AMP receptor protein